MTYVPIGTAGDSTLARPVVTFKRFNGSGRGKSRFMGANRGGLVSTLWRFVWVDAAMARTKDRSNVLAISPSKLHVYGFNGGVRKTAIRTQVSAFVTTRQLARLKTPPRHPVWQVRQFPIRKK